MTSHDVIARLRRVVGQRRIGHAGTLDPAATGVLVVGLGQATRLIEYVQEATSKRYTATVTFGVTTATDDGEGETIAVAPVPQLGVAEIEAQLAAFRGPIMQEPPMYSALHHDGKRLHELARAGVTVERAARPVTIERLELVAWEAPILMLDVVCSKGTYIRSLARDIGAALGCGAHLSALRRTAVGTFTIDTAIPLAQIDTREAAAAALCSPVRAVSDWPAISLDADQQALVRNGRAIALAALDGDQAAALGAAGELVALLRRDGAQWRPVKVFDWSEQ
jgi:tRNA pseudouridine55 synthase